MAPVLDSAALKGSQEGEGCGLECEGLWEDPGPGGNVRLGCWDEAGVLAQHGGQWEMEERGRQAGKEEQGVRGQGSGGVAGSGRHFTKEGWDAVGREGLCQPRGVWPRGPAWVGGGSR